MRVAQAAALKTASARVKMVRMRARARARVRVRRVWYTTRAGGRAPAVRTARGFCHEVRLDGTQPALVLVAQRAFLLGRCGSVRRVNWSRPVWVLRSKVHTKCSARGGALPQPSPRRGLRRHRSTVNAAECEPPRVDGTCQYTHGHHAWLGCGGRRQAGGAARVQGKWRDRAHVHVELAS